MRETPRCKERLRLIWSPDRFLSSEIWQMHAAHALTHHICPTRNMNGDWLIRNETKLSTSHMHEDLGFAIPASFWNNRRELRWIFNYVQEIYAPPQRKRAFQFWSLKRLIKIFYFSLLHQLCLRILLFVLSTESFFNTRNGTYKSAQKYFSQV
jgi:hypothetical protein